MLIWILVSRKLEKSPIIADKLLSSSGNNNEVIFFGIELIMKIISGLWNWLLFTLLFNEWHKPILNKWLSTDSKVLSLGKSLVALKWTLSYKT